MEGPRFIPTGKHLDGLVLKGELSDGVVAEIDGFHDNLLGIQRCGTIAAP